MAKARPPVTTATTRSDPQTTATVTPAGMVSEFVIYWIMSCVSSTMLFNYTNCIIHMMCFTMTTLFAKSVI